MENSESDSRDIMAERRVQIVIEGTVGGRVERIGVLFYSSWRVERMRVLFHSRCRVRRVERVGQFQPTALPHTALPLFTIGSS